MKQPMTRRDILRASAAAAVAGPGLVIAPQADPSTLNSQPSTTRAADPWRGLKIGVASYTFRSHSVEKCIQGIQKVGLKYVSIKDFHLPMNSTASQRKAVADQFRAAGITPLSCGVVNMKNDEANVRQAFEYARDAGIPTIVCAPEPAALPILDRMVKEFDIRLAIHNHGPGDMKFPLPDDVMKAVSSLDPRIGLCIDIGHTLRAGVDPAQAILKCRSRLFDMHLKDITAAAAAGGPVEGGRGVLDLKAVFQAMLQIRFAYLASFEYEKDASDPLAGLAETVGYCKGLVAGLPG